MWGRVGLTVELVQGILWRYLFFDVISWVFATYLLL